MDALLIQENKIILTPKPAPPSPVSPQPAGDDWAWQGRAFDWQRHPKLDAARAALVEWSWNFSGMNEGYALVLAGENGCGKTHLANVTFQTYELNGARFFDEPGLFDNLYGNKQKIIAMTKTGFPLILDDVGKAHTKREWLEEIYWAMLNDNRRPFLITTNSKTLSDLCGWIGQGATSRLLGKMGSNSQERQSHFVDLFGVPDYRTAN